MIFVDTNVLMYAVGREHPLRDEARRFFLAAAADRTSLVTSTEVLQELLHAYLPVGRLGRLDAALQLAQQATQRIWPTEPEDVLLARTLVDRYPDLAARDLLHLASCRRRHVDQIRTFDRALATAFP